MAKSAEAEEQTNNRSDASAKDKVIGKISALGPASVADLAFLLPTHWEDYTSIYDFRPEQHDWEEDESIVVRGVIAETPSTSTSGGVPRISGRIQSHDGWGLLNFTIFGDVRVNRELIRQFSDDILIPGKPNLFQGRPSVKANLIRPGHYAGHLVPTYPGKKGVIGKATVTGRMHELFDQFVSLGAEKVIADTPGGEATALQFAGHPKSRIQSILHRAHWPNSIHQGERAKEAIEKMRTYLMIREVRSMHQRSDVSDRVFPISDGQWRARAQKIPFTLTDEQQEGVASIVDDLRKPESMRRLLSGDVGTGKTAVFAVAAAALIDAGGRVAIAVPGEILAQQIMDNILEWWPDLSARTALVTGNGRRDLLESDLLIGTTALLHRDVGQLNLVIVDEQQRFARHQREGLVKEGVNLLESTATCIPRSMALVQCAGMSVTRLARCHVEKQIRTAFIPSEERQELFEHLKSKIRKNQQILVIYPLKSGGKGDMADKMDVETAARRWERVAPGEVVVASGANDDQSNSEAISRMRNGTAKILVATTVVEVGVDLPDLSNALVVHPERFGLATLHQLRGRIARKGGHGEFLLYSPDELKEKTMDRIKILEEESDGFAIAQGDLKIRGFGNLSSSSEKQSGSTDQVIFGRPTSPDAIDSILDKEAELGITS